MCVEYNLGKELYIEDAFFPLFCEYEKELLCLREKSKSKKEKIFLLKKSKNELSAISKKFMNSYKKDKDLTQIFYPKAKYKQGTYFIGELPVILSEYKSLDKLIIPEKTDFKFIINLSLKILKCWKILSDLGLFYQNVTLKNIIFNDKGDVILYDNLDTLHTSGTEYKPNQSLLKNNRGFIAPEIIDGEKPCLESDFYSLSIILYYLFYKKSPFDCQTVNFSFENNKYRDENSMILPKDFTDNFKVTFTEGLYEPKKRVSYDKWREELINLKEKLFYCQNCNKQNFFFENIKTCSFCEKNLDFIPRIYFNQKIITLIETRKVNSPEGVILEVVTKEDNPNILGIKNLTGKTLTFTLSDKSKKEVPPDKRLRIDKQLEGAEVEFGKNLTGLIKITN